MREISVISQKYYGYFTNLERGKSNNQMSQKNSIFRAAIGKGYSDSEFARAYNAKYHTTISPWRLRVATRDEANKTEAQYDITAKARALVKILRTREDKSVTLSFRAKDEGFTVKEVLEYYREKYNEPDMSYSNFCHAVKEKFLPRQRQIAERADICLTEMVANRK